MSGKIPEKVIAFQAFIEGNVLLGVVDVEVPSVEFMSETLSGAGIAGEIDSPTIGHTAPMSAKLKFRTRTSRAVSLLEPKSHQIELRSSVQSRAIGADGGLVTAPERIILRGLPKGLGGGQLATAKPQDCDAELEIDYMKIVSDGVELLEIDKLNMIYRVLGKDYLAGVRADTGMEG